MVIYLVVLIIVASLTVSQLSSEYRPLKYGLRFNRYLNMVY